jgi:hypothetical protein
MIGIGPPSLSKPTPSSGQTLQHIAAWRKWLSFLLLDCIHLRDAVCVENMVCSLDCRLLIPPLHCLGARTAIRGFEPGRPVRFLLVCRNRATGSKEKGKRLKEKIVVPVVELGKVDILPKRL